jgi:hypothetical protein
MRRIEADRVAPNRMYRSGGEPVLLRLTSNPGYAFRAARECEPTGACR